MNIMNKNQKGFSVVELVVAIAVAGVIIPAVSVALINLSAINYRARDQALANMLAQNKVETLRSLGYNAVNNGTVDFSSELPSTFNSPKSASYTVSSPATGLKQVDVSISYTVYGQSRSVSYRTYIS